MVPTISNNLVSQMVPITSDEQFLLLSRSKVSTRSNHFHLSLLPKTETSPLTTFGEEKHPLINLNSVLSSVPRCVISYPCCPNTSLRPPSSHNIPKDVFTTAWSTYSSATTSTILFRNEQIVIFDSFAKIKIKFHLNLTQRIGIFNSVFCWFLIHPFGGCN